MYMVSMTMLLSVEQLVRISGSLGCVGESAVSELRLARSGYASHSVETLVAWRRGGGKMPARSCRRAVTAVGLMSLAGRMLVCQLGGDGRMKRESIGLSVL